MAVEYCDGDREYGQPYRSRGWYAVNEETGECVGPFSSRHAAECAAGRDPDEER